MPAWAGVSMRRLYGNTGAFLLLTALLAIAVILRWNNLSWDQGHLFHPDERHILMVTAGLALPFPLDWGLLLSPQSPLNPHSFAYGSLPFYLLKLAGTASTLLDGSGLWPSFTGDLDRLRLVGRALSGLFDAGSVLLVFLIGARLFSRRVGLLAAAFLTFSVLNVQYAHFYASDTPVTFFILLAVLASVAVLQKGGWRAAIFAGASIGLALSSKISALPIVAVLAAALFLRLFVSSEEGTARFCWRTPHPAEVNRAVQEGFLALLAAAAVFLIAEPYALIDFKTFISNVSAEKEMARGIADLPYTRQYANTPAYWYFVQNLSLWGLGLPLGVAVLGGALAAVIAVFKRPSGGVILLLAWTVPYFAIVGSFHAKFLRYLIPLIPFLCLLAAFEFEQLRSWLRDRPMPRLRLELAVNAVAAIAVVGGALYAAAFANIYATDHTAVDASQWIYRNVPAGSSIITEHWEEGMPVPLTMDGRHFDSGTMRYRMLELAAYDPDGSAKLSHLTQRLAAADYVVFFSNRLYGTIPRLPQRYPITSRYYQLLFAGQLGFQLEASFEKHASLFGVTLVEDTFADPTLATPAALSQYRPSPITINGGKADESFSVYDHPKVLVFKKEQALSEQQLAALLLPPANSSAASPAPRAPPKTLLLSDASRAVVSVRGTFTDLFDRADLANSLPVPVWAALLELLAVLGAPVAFAVFRRLPDRGFLLARPLAILILTWFDWMLVTMGQLPNSRLAGGVALALLALLASYFVRRQWRDLRAFWSQHKGFIIWGEVLFWGAFGFFLFVRLANPDLWHPARGGEKPMDLAYLMAAIKSATFPPYDPWFAGGYLNYYYYGQIIVATLIKLTGIVPTVAYNLVVPTLFALTFGGVASCAGGLVTLGRRDLRRWVPLGAAGAVGAVVLGNLGGAMQLIDQIMRLGPPPLQSSLPGVQGLLAFLAGLWRLLFVRAPLAIPTDWYWASTRVIEGTINEFPYFTFLYADLHAHMIALPFTALALALAINALPGKSRALSGAIEDPREGRNPRVSRRYRFFASLRMTGAKDVAAGPRSLSFPSGSEAGGQSVSAVIPTSESFRRRTSEEESSPPDAFGARHSLENAADLPSPVVPAEAGIQSCLLHLLVAALVIGALMPTNSWDFPTYLAIYGLTFLAGWYLAPRLEMGGLVSVVLRIFAVAALSYVLYWPFHANYQQWYLGVDQIKDKSDLGGYLRIHGLFLFAIASFLLTQTARRYGRWRLLRAVVQCLRRWDALPRVLALQKALALGERRDAKDQLALYGIFAALALLLVLHLIGMTVLALVGGLLLWTAVFAFDRSNSPQRLFALILISVGLALSAAVEVVAIKGDIGRMNTVFKFYLQIWMLWSVAAVFCLYEAREQIVSLWSPRWRQLWHVWLAVLVGGALVYPLIATRARVADRFDTGVPLTLDGTAYAQRATLREENPDTKQAAEIRLGTDMPAIRWMQDNVPGTPVILEGTAPLYHWGARYSIYTGLPAVIGWDWHQKQQRWGHQIDVDRRLADVRTMYNDPSAERAEALLAKYDVRYIVVGELEKAVYSPLGLAKFDQMIGRGLELVYNNQAVKIYRRL